MAVHPHPHRGAWTDGRLDDLAVTMRDGFNHLESRIDGLQGTLMIGLFGPTGTIRASLAAVLVRP